MVLTSRPVVRALLEHVRLLFRIPMLYCLPYRRCRAIVFSGEKGRATNPARCLLPGSQVNFGERGGVFYIYSTCIYYAPKRMT